MIDDQRDQALRAFLTIFFHFIGIIRRDLCDFDVTEVFLDGRKHFEGFFVVDEGDGDTGTAESTGTADSVDVCGWVSLAVL